jgi:hypothetical protein
VNRLARFPVTMSDATDQPDLGRTVPAETVDRTIRNQRYQCWPAWAWFGAWTLLWMPAIVIMDRLTPREWKGVAGAATCVPILGTGFLVLRHLDGRPVHRIKLGNQLRAYPRPGPRYWPSELVAVRFFNDEDGDYVEGARPVPLCQVEVEGRRGRPMRLVASVGDAARLREWAEQHGVPVVDPYGLAVSPSAAEPSG